MFGRKKQKHKGFNGLKVKKRSNLDKVIDILDAAATKDKQHAYKPKKKVKHKMKETNKSNWNPQISW